MIELQQYGFDLTKKLAYANEVVSLHIELRKDFLQPDLERVMQSKNGLQKLRVLSAHALTLSCSGYTIRALIDIVSSVPNGDYSINALVDYDKRAKQNERTVDVAAVTPLFNKPTTSHARAKQTLREDSTFAYAKHARGTLHLYNLLGFNTHPAKQAKPKAQPQQNRKPPAKAAAKKKEVALRDHGLRARNKLIKV